MEKPPRIVTNRPDDDTLGRASNNIETGHEKVVEGALTSEQIEKVMAKVKDIDEAGTAVTFIRAKSGKEYIPEYKAESLALASALELGLLGFEYKRPVDSESESDSYKEAWITDSRKERTGMVFANIVGRDIERVGDAFGLHYGGIGIVYRLDAFEEHAPTNSQFASHPGVKTFRTHTYRSRVDSLDNDGMKKWLLDENSEYQIQKALRARGIFDASVDYGTFLRRLQDQRESLVAEVKGFDIDGFIQAAENANSYESLFGSPRSDNGFIVTRRVAPRYFDGILIPPPMDRTGNKANWSVLGKEEGQKEIDKKTLDIVRIMAELTQKTGHDRFVPIYDNVGNLLWPKQLSHEDVKKLVPVLPG